MFVSEKIVYLQLQKTGCTHIASLLKDIVGGEEIGKHNRLPPDYQGGKFVLGSVRNPWDWYVSLWAYGCGGAGDVYHRLAARPFDRQGFNANPLKAGISWLARMKFTRKWRGVYACAENPELFRRWLCMIHDPANHPYLGENYHKSSIRAFAGFYTYRYAYLYLRDAQRLYSGEINTLEELKSLLAYESVLDFVIHQEKLEEDVLHALSGSGVSFDLRQRQGILNRNKTNTSSRIGSLEYYYDRDSIDLVKTRERAIIEMYGYEEPGLASAAGLAAAARV